MAIGWLSIRLLRRGGVNIYKFFLLGVYGEFAVVCKRLT